MTYPNTNQEDKSPEELGVELRHTMLELWLNHPAAFDSVIHQHIEKASAVLPSENAKMAEEDPLARIAEAVILSVWVEVNFLRWRDQKEVQQACEWLAHRNAQITKCYIQNNPWLCSRVPCQSTPEESDNANDPRVNCLKKIFNYFQKLGTDSQELGTQYLNSLKSAVEGRTSPFDKDYIDRWYPIQL